MKTNASINLAQQNLRSGSTFKSFIYSEVDNDRLSISTRRGLSKRYRSRSLMCFTPERNMSMTNSVRHRLGARYRRFVGQSPRNRDSPK